MKTTQSTLRRPFEITNGGLGPNLPESAGRMADIYHFLLTSKWWKLFLTIGTLYLVSNSIFAFLYWISGAQITNARENSYWDLFFFSAQTLTTVGYGNLSPHGMIANVLVCIESFMGLMGFALASGLTFAKFSRPTARVVFSHVAVVTVRDGAKVLMFRMANGRKTSRVVEAQLSVVLLKTVKTREGELLRKLHDVTLVRSKTPSFLLSWTAIHPIDENSPLWNETPETLARCSAQLTATLSGIEGSFSQTVHATHSYALDRILFGQKFRDIFVSAESKTPVFDYSLFHETVPDNFT